MQSRGFLDRVLQFMGIQEQEEEQEAARMVNITPGKADVAATAEDVPTTVDAKKRPRLVSIPGAGKGTSNMKVSVVYPKSYDDVQSIADQLKLEQPVIVSLDAMEGSLSRRIIDFMSGVTYALEGRIHRIGDGIFLVAPTNVSIDAVDTFNFQSEGFLHDD